ncbi:MAG TPA: septum formation initiator family protein [Anaeromyxobacteraceae bacterium]
MPLLARRRFLLGYLAAVLALLGLSAADRDGLRKARRNESEAERLERENAALEQRVARLRREVKALQGDPAALERAAREELGYVRPGELVYKLDEGGRP